MPLEARFIYRSIHLTQKGEKYYKRILEVKKLEDYMLIKVATVKYTWTKIRSIFCSERTAMYDLC